MSVYVHTYSEPKEWARHPQYSSFPEAIHICATNNQRNGIQEYYGNDLKHIYSFRKFAKALYMNWYNPETKFQQYLRLSKIIADFQYVQPELRKAFRTNAMEVLESIRFFVEANIKPHNLEDKWLLTEKERFFKEVWEIFLQQDEASKEHYLTLQGTVTKKRLEKVISVLSGSDNNLKDELQIVLHGFYFVTPEQQIILEALRKKFNITFFHYYDERYPETFDFIKAFVTDRFGWPSPDQWVYDLTLNKNSTIIANNFLAAYENNVDKSFKSDKTITAYSSFFDFLQDIILPNFPYEGNEKNKIDVISPNAQQLNELLLSYYPELNKKKRNFLSYPIGRFLVSLHETYNGGELYLTEDILIEIFSSGWLYDETENENAQNYTYDLQQIFPYLKDCRDFDSWRERINQLVSQGLAIEKAFPMDLENRIIRSVRSPFAKISYFAVPLPRLKQIAKFIEIIQRTAKNLFEQSSSNKIDQHFKRLKDILKTHGIGASLIADENEKQLIVELEKKLENIQDDSEFLYDDLQNALHFYLSGKLDDNDENYIIDFLEIDGEMFKPKGHPIFLTGIDENSMPLGTPSIPWPLQYGTFEFLSERHLPLQLLSIRSRANKSISKYLFFIALNLQADELHLSWIKNMLDQNEMQPALYIKQLGLKEVNYTASLSGEEVTYKPYDFSEERVEKESLEEGWKTLAFDDFLAEFKLCPKRFYYSYIADEYPKFSSDFIHQFMFTEIIKIAAHSTKANFETVLNEVSPLFPQWLNFKKRVSAKTAIKYVPAQLGGKTEVLEAHSYTETRKKFQFPGLKNQARTRLFTETTASVQDILKELTDKENNVLQPNQVMSVAFVLITNIVKMLYSPLI
ncbi:hypothetical protein L1279_001136 [Planomicrobium sp. HSC-17F08]|nr:hypothetical protein [Planomicrobium sp. HSC-17F08]